MQFDADKPIWFVTVSSRGYWASSRQITGYVAYSTDLLVLESRTTTTCAVLSSRFPLDRLYLCSWCYLLVFLSFAGPRISCPRGLEVLVYQGMVTQLLHRAGLTTSFVAVFRVRIHVSFVLRVTTTTTLTTSMSWSRPW